MAKLFAEKCLQIGQREGLAPFYLGYAFEALARAELVHKNMPRAKEILSMARKELEQITDIEERKLLEADIAALDQ